METIPCPDKNCYSGCLIPTGNKHHNHTYSHEYHCSECPRNNIYVCVGCRNAAFLKNKVSIPLMFVFQNYDAMRRHGTRYHYSDKCRKLSAPEENNAPTYTNSDEDDSAPTSLNDYYSFPNHNTESYVNTCISRGCLFAIVQMVVSSCYGSHQVLPELLVTVDLDDVYLFLSIARLVTRMGTVNSSLLSKCSVGRNGRMSLFTPMYMNSVVTKAFKWYTNILSWAFPFPWCS
jgi:hypothetical protein